MTKKIYLILFSTILLVGVFLRFFDLGKVPDSLNWDEVSWGYNAYSILQTGRDEYGVFMPSSFQAFGDYKQPVYVYLTTLSIGIFGLNEFAVRFPSALLGSLSIIFVWFLVFSLFYKEQYRDKLSLLAMFFFSVSPWSIQFSRVAFEANIGIFFVISGVSLFLYGLNTKRIYLALIGVVLLSISCYSYHSNKIFTPLIFVALLAFAKFRHNLSKKTIILIAALFLLLNAAWLIDTRTTARGRSVTFVSNQTPILENSAKQLVNDRERDDQLGAIFHNRRIVYANYYFENYLKHFDPNFLFIEGDNARHHPFGMGVIYLVSLPLLLIGIIKLNLKKYWLVPIWILLAPVASALAVDAPNASRSLVFLPTWQILEALGLLYILNLKNFRIRLVATLGILFLFTLHFVYFSHNYFKHTNSEYGIYWQSGYEEIVTRAKGLSIRDKVFISNKYEQPYVFYLFHNKIDPVSYLESGGSRNHSDQCYSIERVNFGNCEEDQLEGAILISPEEFIGEEYSKIDEVLDSESNVVGFVYRRE